MTCLTVFPDGYYLLNEEVYKELVHNSFVGGFDIAYPAIPIFFWRCYLAIYLLLHLFVFFFFLPEFATGLIHLVMLFFELGHSFG